MQIVAKDEEVIVIAADANLAAQARAEVQPLLEQLVVVMNKYRAKHGLNVGFNVQLDQFGRYRTGPIDVTRPL